MKPLQMRAPGLQQIYNQKYQYQQHKRKLLKIYENRKSQLCYDSNRSSQFQSFKQTKVKSFINKFNRTNQNIAKDNLKLLAKLETVKSSLNKVTDDQSKNHNFLTPFVKKRIVETQKQNYRISQKMKNMSSSLSQRRFIKEYEKSQKIKSRIMRYTTEDSGVFLKSKRYFDGRDQRNSSVLSQKSNISRPSIYKSECSAEPRKAVSKPALQKTTASHYRKQDILRNRVETRQASLASIKLKMKFRPITSIQGNPQNQANQNQQDAAFFPTQPKKNKIIRLIKSKA